MMPFQNMQYLYIDEVNVDKKVHPFHKEPGKYTPPFE